MRSGRREAVSPPATLSLGQDFVPGRFAADPLGQVFNQGPDAVRHVAIARKARVDSQFRRAKCGQQEIQVMFAYRRFDDERGKKSDPEPAYRGGEQSVAAVGLKPAGDGKPLGLAVKGEGPACARGEHIAEALMLDQVLRG